LGVAERIVAVDSTSQFPPEALQSKANIGYMRALSTEGVLSMAPSMIVASEKAGPPEVVKALKSSSVPYVEIDDSPEPGALARRIADVAKLVGRTERGTELTKKVEAGFKSLEKARGDIKSPIRAVFILSVQNGRLVVGGRNTSADSMLKLAGATNVMGTVEGFKPVTEEALVELDPEVIVTMSRSSAEPLQRQLAKLPGIMGTKAGRNGRILEKDALLLLGFGPRAPEAAFDLMHEFYGSAKPLANSTKKDGSK